MSGETSTGEELTFTAFEVGAQLVVYPLAPFESLQAGIELLYLRVEIDEELGDTQVSGLGDGLAAGPLVGYKLLTEVGFTLVVQGGVSFAIVKAEARNATGQSASAGESAVLPLLNLNLGWSF